MRVTDEAVDQTLQRLRERAAKSSRSRAGRRPTATRWSWISCVRTASGPDRHEGVSIEIGSKANPPGFDANLIGLSPATTKTFTIHFPEDYAVTEMAGTDVEYSVTVKDVRRVLPELDDEFAKDLGEFDSLAALRDRVRTDLQAEAEENATRQLAASCSSNCRSGSRSSCRRRSSSAKSTADSRNSPGS